MNYELYIPEPIKPRGRYQKGHVPHNKGKSWDDFAGKRAQKKMSAGWKNLLVHRPKSRPDTSGRCRKAVIAVFNDGTWKHFCFAGSAVTWLGGRRDNINRCCRMNKERPTNHFTGEINTDHKYMGVRFYFEDDEIWLEKINNGF